VSKGNDDMDKLTPKDGASPDIVVENIEKLREIFPQVFADGSVDFDALKETLGEYVDDREERYSFTWHGKSRARRIAQMPSSGTLLPCPEESVNWDETKNIFIEGDNLEVLKLLQKSYHRKVKMIYIDPPYNTGKEFIYPDKFQDNLDTYLKFTGQVDDEGFKLSANAETSGRYHTNWLNMMYPRLKLARNLLLDDGAIFVSIDDHEVHNLRHLMDEIYGPENFLACFVWKSRQNKDNRTLTGASIDHEYVLVYGRKIRGAARNTAQYSNPDNDERGDWTSANMVGIATADRRPNLHYDLINPDTGINYGCPGMGWRYEPSTMDRLREEDRILWPPTAEGRPRRKAFLSELSSEFTGFSSLVGDGIFTRDGTADIDKLFGSRIFSFPKPVRLLEELIEQGCSEEGIVLDFFAGSGTTAHAVMSLSVSDQVQRHYITVQLPEPLDPKSKEQKTAALYCESLQQPQTIAELTKERLRRAGTILKKEYPLVSMDFGFKVFKLSSSNLKPWDADFDDLDGALLDAIDNIKSDRSQEDVLYELLLKYGLDLAIPTTERTVAGKKVFIIGAGALVVCLDSGITLDVVRGIADLKAELKPEIMRVVFKDSGFKDDVVKTNTVQILKQADVDDVKSL